MQTADTRPRPLRRRVIDAETPTFQMCLAWLDVRLKVAIDAAEALYGAPGDTFCGLYVTEEQAVAYLARIPGQPLFAANAAAPPPQPRQLARLADTFALTPLDRSIVVLALASELDLRYERIYAYLQDDVNRRRPTIDLALNLFCEDAQARIAARARFAPEALAATGVLAIECSELPLPARELRLADDVVAYLTGGECVVATELSDAMRFVTPAADLDGIVIADAARAVLKRAAASAPRDLRLLLHGAPGRGQAGGGRGAGARARSSAARHRRASRGGRAGARRVPGRRAQPSGDLCARSRRRGRRRAVVAAVATGFAAGGACRRDARRALDVPPAAGIPQRRSRCGRGADRAARVARVGRGRRGQRAGGALPASRARHQRGRRRRERPRPTAKPTCDELFAAAREQSARVLSGVAQRVEPSATWNDLVLPDRSLALLRRLCERAERRSKVLDEWGFGDVGARGRGIAALFSGPPGCGKTLAAEVIAGALGLDLYQIDLARTISKYIGETEQNLERVFAAAEDASAILFFDEADALFGKRSEVRDAHDRYANLEVSYLLQRMERYDGIAILASNLSDHLDQAFARRLAREILAVARATDEAEDELFGEARGDELPEQLRTSEGRRRWLAEAKRELKSRQGANAPEAAPGQPADERAWMPRGRAIDQGRRGWLRDARQRLDERREREARPISRSRAARLSESRRRLEEELAAEREANEASGLPRARDLARRAPAPLTCVAIGSGLSLEELDTLTSTDRGQR